ncbi:MAG: dephospho-CoA kinase [Clostridia bacterium]|nr:dephospho-CoA kinase [Clostridia bacterium]
MSKLIAITGKMGCGKSLVLNIFSKKGYKVLSADKIYHELLLNQDFVKEISLAVGVEPLYVNGKATLDKVKVSKVVFSDKEKLEILNKITHPKIMQEMLNRANGFGGVVFCEVPLLQGSGYENSFSVVIEVKRQENLSSLDASKRDNILQTEVQKRQKFQPEYENLSGITHIIIYNNGSIIELEQKVSAIENKIF